MSRQVKKQKIYVAMSGGVDSSVAAALLKKQGYDVIGVFMKPWSPGEVNSTLLTESCLWQKDREDAMRVASVLDIPLLTWDFSKEYKKEVTDYMIREYKAGRTPNPDVMCNKHIKFGLFLDKALK
ncbi:MAG: tRNA 2-thiouridine(34) synthase MnmA, partial [Patescibacteria group bacterium]